MKHAIVRAVAATALLLGTTAVAAFVTAAPALAATCSGYGCDGQDPIASGCNTASVYTVTSAPIVYAGITYGTVELRWSPTCGTNWARTTLNSQYIGMERQANVLRQSPAGVEDWHYTGPGNPIYGNMLYAPGCAEAEGEVWISYGNEAEGWAVQPGCSQF